MSKGGAAGYRLGPKVAGLGVSVTLRANEEVAAKRRAGEKVYHMGFGESPFPVPQRIRDALTAGAEYGGYPPTLGLAELRSRALSYFSARLGFDESAMGVIVGPGSKDLIFAAQLAIDGDLVLPTPSWVSYAPQAQLAGTETIRIPTVASNHHALCGSLIRETVAEAQTRGLNPRKLILNAPNNPTGLSFQGHDLEEIAEVCRDLDLIVFSDEIYALISHGHRHESLAVYYPGGTIVTTGLSKHLSLGGYRVGFAFVPKALEGLLQAMETVASETWSAVSHPVQHAAISALEEHDDIEAHIKLCTKAHGLATNYIRDALINADVDYPPLAGAFYLYPDFSRFRGRLKTAYGVETSDDLAADLLSRLNIVTLPGTDFGDAPNVLTLRLAATDYDGEKALTYLRSEPKANQAQFVEAVCPRIAESCELLCEYFASAVAD
jgi:aspartate/methionine/tyrosine aminotransferase